MIATPWRGNPYFFYDNGAQDKKQEPCFKGINNGLWRLKKKPFSVWRTGVLLTASKASSLSGRLPTLTRENDYALSNEHDPAVFGDDALTVEGAFVVRPAVVG
jgi:hypothetical protein